MYLSNSSSHSACDKGGRTPDTGRHSVILKPDSVNRVTPPTTMTAKTRAEEPSSHIATEGGDSTGSPLGNRRAPDALVEKKRGSNGRPLSVPESSLRCPVTRIVPLKTLLQWIWLKFASLRDICTLLVKDSSGARTAVCKPLMRVNFTFVNNLVHVDVHDIVLWSVLCARTAGGG